MESKLCANLNALRTLHGYSFKDLEKLMTYHNCKISASTLQRYEVGKIPNVPYDSIIALAEIYQVTPSALMGWTDDPILNIAEKDLITDFRKLNPAGQTAAAAAVKGFTQMQQYKNDDSAPTVKEEVVESSAQINIGVINDKVK